MFMMKFIPSFLIFTFTFLFYLSARTQTIRTYDAQWKAVDNLIQKKNLPKSALEEVKKIYTQAKIDKQDAQIIKSLVYITALQQENREDNIKISIREIEKEILQNKEPAVSILKSLAAELYWQYFQQYRWQLYNRTNTINFIKDDISTWTSEDFHKRISDLYLSSIEKASLLQQTKLESFNAIIVKGNVRHLRPTLYDLLAHKAITYFRNSERDIKKPAYAFEITDPKAFAPANEFIQTKFPIIDSLSLQHKALLVYQDLIRFHLKDKDPAALIDIDIQRIQFVRDASVVENKDELYLRALEGIAKNSHSSPVALEAIYLIGLYYEQLAADYDPVKDTTNRFSRIKAKQILEEWLKNTAAKNYAVANIKTLLREINKKEFSFEVEKVNIPDRPMRALVKYRNISTLNLRLIKASDEIKNLLRNGVDEKYWSELNKVVPYKSWVQQLPETNDLQPHAVEIKIDALPVGDYILIASSESHFNPTNNLLGAQLFYMSNISYVNKGDQFYILNRDNGQPIPNASVQLYTQHYDYASYKYSKSKIGTFKTDDHGYFKAKVRKDESNRGFFLEIVDGKDHLFLDDMIYSYQYYDEERPKNLNEPKRIFFFTDRSIYRPAQTIYFKGILIEKTKDGNRIVADAKKIIYLRDVNFQIIDSLQLTSNEFGSFNGRFVLPSGGLNGSFQIIDKEGISATSFLVEEYKRPKFYVEIDKIKESYKVGDSIRVTGNAKAYAGYTVTNAKVNYRVVRQPRFIYRWLNWRWWQPRAEPMEIAHGSTTTGIDGSFSISFTAIPDKKIDPELQPVFDYHINIDITDINGESRSNAGIVSAAYKSLLLKVNLEEKLPLDSIKNISIRPENMNGEYQPSAITVAIFSLLPEQRLIRKRYWQQPDQFVLSKEEFIIHFPHDEYRNESDYRTWTKGVNVFTKTDSSKMNSQFPITNSQLTPGYYRIEITTKDKDGKEVKDVRIVELYDPKNNRLNKPEYLWTRGSTPIEPGEKTNVVIGSSAQDVFLIYQIERSTQIQEVKNEFTKIKNEKKSFEYKATEEDRGGFGVNYFFVKHNRFYQYTEIINVPWTNKDLSVEYTTYRDKTLPGSEEKWKVKLRGYTGDKIAAEMLASMYDASLDQFNTHSWEKPGIWPLFSKMFQWQSGQNFSAVQSFLTWLNQPEYLQGEKIYDQLKFNLYGNIIGLEEVSDIRLQGEATTSAPMERNKMASQSMETDASAIEKSKQVMDTILPTQKTSFDQSGVQIRKNQQETAFFFPDLKTDKQGNIEFTFTAPESLTSWKLQTIAHTKELAFGVSQKELFTQKKLMVQPNAPRFLRQGDRMEFSTKVVNLTNKELTGQVEFQLIDATTNQSVDGWFMNSFPNQYFTVAAGQSEAIKFPIEVPFQFSNVLTWRIIARSNPGSDGEPQWSDGEESILPVLSNKVLVTETLPLPIRGETTKNFTFEKLLKNSSETALNHSLAVEFTANPAWLAIQALPYLTEGTNESAEQTWNRYYANALAGMIINTAPRIKQIVATWKTFDTSALLSNLQKNQELKSALLEETPWVLAAKGEEQQKKNIALLFDLVRMNNELKNNLEKLKNMQAPNGGFVWFKGGPDDRYMTLLILTGMGHLKKLGAVPENHKKQLETIVAGALKYSDAKMKEDYEKLVKMKVKLNQPNTGYSQIQYLYMRSFFSQTSLPQSAQVAYVYYRSQSQQYWSKQNKYMQGMIALALYRSDDKQTPRAIIKSLKETAIIHDELGMYWKDHSFGYSWYWWHAPIETQSLLIEAFNEISNDTKTVDDLRTWLLKNKQTNNWRTTKATADACYALLLQGSDWLSSDHNVDIKLGSSVINNKKEQGEAGTGYFKKTIEGRFVTPEMGNISVMVKNNTGLQKTSSSSWGAVYWQYFEDMDKVTSAATPLRLSKKLFIENNTDRGPRLTPVNESTRLNVGAKIKVRIELRVDRDMEYLHMKDLRATALEPVNVLSGYKWQGGLGYYETTKDASTSFFFDFLRKGTYVFEYPLFVTHAGYFSNGITTIQSMYAPEFSAHSEGVKIIVDQ